MGRRSATPADAHAVEQLLAAPDGKALQARAELRTRPPIRVAFLFLGRQGSFAQFVLELAKAATGCESLDPSLVIARSSKIAAQFDGLDQRHFMISTWDDQPVPELITNFHAARRALLSWLAFVRPAAVVTLMPHVWTPLLAPAIRQLGILYVSVVHDAVPHPGDPTAILTPWLLRDVHHADVVITLSRAVAHHLVSTRRVSAARVVPLFHPDLHYAACPVARHRMNGDPLRLLFFGRILKYKGLPLVIDAVERLRAEGIPVQLGIAGVGNIGVQRSRLEALQAEVVNRWIEDHEVGPLLARYDCVVLSHIEASQSGVAAAAFGTCMPVVAAPVGGLVEQVVDGQTGVLAQGLSTASIADAIRKLVLGPALYNSISQHLAATAGDRSMQRFVAELAGVIAGRGQAMGPIAGYNLL